VSIAVPADSRGTYKPVTVIPAKIHYFTRSPVPYAMKHIGVYGINGYRFIQDSILCHNFPFPMGSNCYITEQEDLEQLNWINAGITVTGLYVPRESAGTVIDTQADYDSYCKTLEQK